MLKKLLLIVFSCFALYSAHTLAADKFEAGKHYEVVAKKATAKPEVREFFSFYCGHCFAFEPVMQTLAKQLPAGVAFEKNHVDFLQAASPELQNQLTRAYAVAKSLGKGDEIAGSIFNYIHKQRASFSNADDIRSLMLVNGLDAAKYDAKVNSMPILSAATEMKALQDRWSKQQVLTGVPSLIVNGKYKVKMDSLEKEADPVKTLSELVNFLALKKD